MPLWENRSSFVLPEQELRKATSHQRPPLVALLVVAATTTCGACGKLRAARPVTRWHELSAVDLIAGADCGDRRDVQLRPGNLGHIKNLLVTQGYKFAES